jgi:hypothetical protein
VRDALLVRLIQRIRDGNGNFERFIQRHRTPRQARGPSLALDEFHDQKIDVVLPADVVQRADMRMVQGRDRLCLALEPLPHVRVLGKAQWQHFDRYRAVQASVCRLVDFTHTPAPMGSRI